MPNRVVDRVFASTIHHTQTLRYFGHWFNSIAVYAPEARVVIVGTHKDELKDVAAGVRDAQEIMTDFIPSLFWPGKTRSVEFVQQTSKGDWFFPVESVSRETTQERDYTTVFGFTKEVVQCRDPVIQELRHTLEQMVLTDDRTVKGLFVDGIK